MKIDKGFDEAVEGLEKAEGDQAIVGHLSAPVHSSTHTVLLRTRDKWVIEWETLSF